MNYSSHLISDICELIFENTNNVKCEIDYCGVCKNDTICQICEIVKNAELKLLYFVEVKIIRNKYNLNLY